MRVTGGALGESRSVTGDSTSRGDSSSKLALLAAVWAFRGGGVVVDRRSKALVADGLGVSLVSEAGSWICTVGAKRRPEGSSGDSSTGGASR